VNRRTLGVIVAAIGVAVTPWFHTSAIQAATRWHVVKRASVSGEFATTAINATIQHPKAIGVRLLGNVQSGLAVVACSKGFSVSSNSRQYSHAGTFSLPITRGADSCDVTASVGGSGRLTVQILRG
jgi:hypothetical protein